jgi:hypothetical protein
MKRFLGVVFLFLAALLVLPSISQAGQTYSYRWIGPIQFCTGCGSTTGGETDSTYIYKPNAADVQDTSMTIVLPTDFVYATDADSIPCFVLRATESVAAASGDTLYALITPSVDNTNFTEPTWSALYPLISGTATSAAYPYRLATSYAASLNWINVAPKSGIRSVRIRLYWDGTAATTGGGVVRVYLGYLVKT